ncbi:MAG: type II CAAX endopeptidase family protein [Myxococcota bacterium]|jgi:membrane protease YdiL (CAAX protease family)|nr:type II CAAX endopeptidase family protein [Myxococcota bacterium]
MMAKRKGKVPHEAERAARPQVEGSQQGCEASASSRAELAGAEQHWLLRLWQRYVVQGFEEDEQQSRAQTAARPPWRIDWTVVGIFVLASVCLSLIEYVGKSQYYWEYIHARPLGEGVLDHLRVDFARNPSEAPSLWFRLGVLTQPLYDSRSAQGQIGQLLYWAFWCVTAYFVLPALFVKLVLRRKLSDFGLRLRGVIRHLWLYLLMFAVVLPLVFVVSSEDSFKQTYPFYRNAPADPGGFWTWELAYAAQFFSLEFFFRGFLVHGLKHRLGAYAVMAMVLPYCMIHFGKPLPETMGAIIAGTVLGFLSLRSGSIVLGFLIHVSVALSMDLVSLWRQDQLQPIISWIISR